MRQLKKKLDMFYKYIIDNKQIEKERVREIFLLNKNYIDVFSYLKKRHITYMGPHYEYFIPFLLASEEPGTNKEVLDITLFAREKILLYLKDNNYSIVEGKDHHGYYYTFETIPLGVYDCNYEAFDFKGAIPYNDNLKITARSSFIENTVLLNLYDTDENNLIGHVLVDKDGRGLIFRKRVNTAQRLPGKETHLFD